MALSKVGGWVFFLTSYDVIRTQNQYVSDTLAHISFAQKKKVYYIYCVRFLATVIVCVAIQVHDHYISQSLKKGKERKEKNWQ